MRRSYLYSFRGRGRRISPMVLGIQEPFAIDIRAYNRRDAIGLLLTIRRDITICSVVRHKGGIAS